MSVLLSVFLPLGFVDPAFMTRSGLSVQMTRCVKICFYFYKNRVSGFVSFVDEITLWCTWRLDFSPVSLQDG